MPGSGGSVWRAEAWWEASGYSTARPGDRHRGRSDGGRSSDRPGDGRGGGSRGRRRARRPAVGRWCRGNSVGSSCGRSSRSHRALMGDTVILTASAGSFPGLVEALKEVPIAVEERPLLSFSPPVDWTALDVALDHLDSYGAVAFTSPRAARAVVERMQARRTSWGGGGRPEVWAVGPATSTALEGAPGSVRLPPERPGGKVGAAAALARAMLEAEVDGPVLFPCGETRREELAGELRKGGVEVKEVVCYRSV